MCFYHKIFTSSNKLFSQFNRFVPINGGFRSIKIKKFVFAKLYEFHVIATIFVFAFLPIQTDFRCVNKCATDKISFSFFQIFLFWKVSRVPNMEQVHPMMMHELTHDTLTPKPFYLYYAPSFSNRLQLTVSEVTNQWFIITRQQFQ